MYVECIGQLDHSGIRTGLLLRVKQAVWGLTERRSKTETERLKAGWWREDSLARAVTTHGGGQSQARVAPFAKRVGASPWRQSWAPPPYRS